MMQDPLTHCARGGQFPPAERIEAVLDDDNAAHPLKGVVSVRCPCCCHACALYSATRLARWERCWRSD